MITLEKFITDLQRERAEVAFYIFTNGSQTLEMNLTTRNQAYIFVEHQLTFIPKVIYPSSQKFDFQTIKQFKKQALS